MLQLQSCEGTTLKKVTKKMVAVNNRDKNAFRTVFLSKCRYNFSLFPNTN